MELTEAIETSYQENGFQVPEDLSHWVDKRTLVSLVLKIVGEVDPRLLQPVASANAGIAFQPKLLLALLTYCYTVGIWGSREIEEVLHEDLTFRFICANEYPDWHVIRRFRRHNRETIRHCSEATLRAVLTRRPGRRLEAPNGRNRFDVPPTNGTRTPSVELDFIAKEAADRLEKALLMDSIALDD